MAKNIGTLITAAIRPNDSLDLIASAFASEIRGGLHTVSDLNGRNDIMSVRREWGMLCYVESVHTTFQLSHNHVDVDIDNNANWVVFDSGGPSVYWLDTVMGIENDPFSLTPNIGDRYIVGSNPSGDFTGHLWEIATWDGSNWGFEQPADGATVNIVGGNNFLYEYNAMYNEWRANRTSQVLRIDASSGDGLLYTASNDLYNGEEDVILISKFNIMNTGAVTLNISGLTANIKKQTSNGLVNLNSNDIRDDLSYAIIYNGVDFQLINVLGATVDGQSIRINNNGEIYVHGRSVYQVESPNTTSGNDQATGVIISGYVQLYSTVKVAVNGQLVHLGNSSTADCYYKDVVNNVPRNNIDDIQTGDELYWNGNNAGYELDNNTDIIMIIYESE